MPSFPVSIALVLALPAVALAEDVPERFNPPPGVKPVEVSAHFFLSDVSDIDERSETFQVKGSLQLTWSDPRHAFDPEREGVEYRKYQGPFQFLEMYNGWWPQLVLSNGLEPIGIQGVALKISPSGECLLVQEVSAILKSPMDLRRYPFDRQTLQIMFEPLASYATEVELVSGPNMTDVPDYPIRIAGWDVRGLMTETYVEHDESSGAKYSHLLVNLDVERQPEFVIWFVMIPLSLIVLLSTAIFWMDHESLGTRMDISFIGLLTIVAYQSFVGSSFPQINYFTLLSGFLYVAYSTMAFCVASNLVVDKLDRKGKGAAADRFDSVCRWGVPAGFVGINVLSAVYWLHA